MALEQTATAGAWPGHNKKHGFVRIGLCCALVGLMGLVGYHAHVDTHKMHDSIVANEMTPSLRKKWWSRAMAV